MLMNARRTHAMGVTNFAYGTGPYLRTTELAIAFNDELEKSGRERIPFIVPWVYGEKQRRIMLEEFEGNDAVKKGEILLDKALGAILRSVFYGDNSYKEALSKWARSVDAVSKKAHDHLNGTISVETLFGEKIQVNGGDIVAELNRSPRIRYEVAPAYSTTFGHVAEILDAALGIDQDIINIDKRLLYDGIEAAQSVERAQKISTIAYPATFSWKTGHEPRYGNEILVPPITSLPHENTEDIEEGIFVTVTGIPGLEGLYEEARHLGLKLYCNDTEAVSGSTKALPRIIPNKNIIFQFARSGWGSIWLSMLSGTPIVVPRFDKEDDPEIYFNNKAVEKLGIGVIYHGQPLSDILAERERIKKNCFTLREDIVSRFGVLSGNEVCARMFAQDFIAHN